MSSPRGSVRSGSPASSSLSAFECSTLSTIWLEMTISIASSPVSGGGEAWRSSYTCLSSRRFSLYTPIERRRPSSVISLPVHSSIERRNVAISPAR